MESDEVFHLTAKISSNSNVADKHPILVNFEPCRGLLAPGARVDGADVDLQTIENGIALCGLAFFENFAVKLLHHQHGSATCQDEYCGDGIKQPGEQCDDGNTNSGDGCTPYCVRDVVK